MTPNERLLHLAGALEKNAANPNGMKFDLHLYLHSSGDRRGIDCGTVGCALGLAMMLPEFNAEGFSGFEVPSFGGEEGFNAARKFFDITFDQAQRLFISSSYEVTMGAGAEREVAGRIRKLVQERDID